MMSLRPTTRVLSAAVQSFHNNFYFQRAMFATSKLARFKAGKKEFMRGGKALKFADCARLISQSTSPAQIWDVLRSRPDFDITVYNTAIQKSGKLRDIDYCKQIMDLMQQREVRPTVVTFNVLFKALRTNQRMDLSGRYLDEMENLHGITPLITTANELLAGCIHQADAERADQIWNDVIMQHQLQPDRITYSTMIKIFGKSGDVNRAREFYDKMMADTNIEVDQSELNVMINAYNINDRADQASSLQETFEKCLEARNLLAVSAV